MDERKLWSQDQDTIRQCTNACSISMDILATGTSHPDLFVRLDVDPRPSLVSQRARSNGLQTMVLMFEHRNAGGDPTIVPLDAGSMEYRYTIHDLSAPPQRVTCWLGLDLSYKLGEAVLSMDQLQTLEVLRTSIATETTIDLTEEPETPPADALMSGAEAQGDGEQDEEASIVSVDTISPPPSDAGRAPTRAVDIGDGPVSSGPVGGGEHVQLQVQPAVPPPPVDENTELTVESSGAESSEEEEVADDDGQEGGGGGLQLRPRPGTDEGKYREGRGKRQGRRKARGSQTKGDGREKRDTPDGSDESGAEDGLPQDVAEKEGEGEEEDDWMEDEDDDEEDDEEEEDDDGDEIGRAHV